MKKRITAWYYGTLWNYVLPEGHWIQWASDLQMVFWYLHQEIAQTFITDLSFQKHCTQGNNSRIPKESQCQYCSRNQGPRRPVTVQSALAHKDVWIKGVSARLTVSHHSFHNETPLHLLSYILFYFREEVARAEGGYKETGIERDRDAYVKDTG